MKDVVRSFEKVLKFDKHLKKAGGHIGRNVVERTIKMKTIVRKPLMININKLRLRNLDNWNLFPFALMPFRKEGIHSTSCILNITDWVLYLRLAIKKIEFKRTLFSYEFDLLSHPVYSERGWINSYITVNYSLYVISFLLSYITTTLNNPFWRLDFYAPTLVRVNPDIYWFLNYQ